VGCGGGFGCRAAGGRGLSRAPQSPRPAKPSPRAPRSGRLPPTPPQRAHGNEAAALVNAVLGNIIGVFITPLWLTLFLSVSGGAPYAQVGRSGRG
jgi:hypothetical protein